MSEFESLGLGANLLKALADAGYSTPTPIQAQAIPPVLEGRDLLGIAQTGTGKTAAFALPLIELMARKPYRSTSGNARVLVLTPTRELAAQVEASFRTYGRHTPLRSAVIFGGVGQERQVRALRGGLDVLIATPGRLLDLMQQGHARLDKVEFFVLDEADRMLDMGFIRDIKKIVAVLPTVRQTLLFSATMPPEISELAHEQLRDPVRAEVTPQATTVERIEQKLIFVDKSRKRELLRQLLSDASIYQALVFTRTKRGADRVAEDLSAAGIESGAIHGNKAQNHRERTLRAFRSGALRVLVATDIAARGLDIPGVSHVFNYELPDEPESYVHRIGRTARAGREGIAIAFCCSEELEQLRDIERLIAIELPTDRENPLAAPLERLAQRGRSAGSAPKTYGRPQGGHQHHARHRREEGSSFREPAKEGLRAEAGEHRFGGDRGGRRDRPRHEARRDERPPSRGQDRPVGRNDSAESRPARPFGSENKGGHRFSSDSQGPSRFASEGKGKRFGTESKGGNRFSQGGGFSNRSDSSRPSGPRTDGRGPSAPRSDSRGPASARPERGPRDASRPGERPQGSSAGRPDARGRGADRFGRSSQDAGSKRPRRHNGPAGAQDNGFLGGVFKAFKKRFGN